LDGHGQLGILEPLREGLAAVGLQEVPERDIETLPHCLDRQVDITEPGSHASPFPGLSFGILELIIGLAPVTARWENSLTRTPPFPELCLEQPPFLARWIRSQARTRPPTPKHFRPRGTENEHEP